MSWRRMFRGTRVFVTGHTGFKGSWLTAWLLELGAEITGYALPPPYSHGLFELLGLATHIRHREGDIRNLDLLEREMRSSSPDFVFHLAAQTLVREGYRNPKTTFDVNIGGAVNLLDAVRRVDSVRALVFVTSDKCYQNREWVWGYREIDPMGGQDPYSSSKGCAELVFDAYLKSFFLPEGRVNAASARSGNVLGGGDWAQDRLVPDCVRALLHGERVFLRNPLATRPWQHVLDPLYGYLLLGSKLFGPTGREFSSGWNFGPDPGANRTVMELAQDVARLWGREGTIVEHAPSGPHEASFLSLNCDKAHNLLRWRPLRQYKECVEQTVSWYKAYGGGEDMRPLTLAEIEDYMRDMPLDAPAEAEPNLSRGPEGSEEAPAQS